MTSSSSAKFSPVMISACQAENLETLMKQQVNDAILARSIQEAKHNKLNSNWRAVGSLGQLRTFKLRGADPCSSTSSWATTLENTTRATACSLNEEVYMRDTQTWTIRNRRSEQPISRRTIGNLYGRRSSVDSNPPLQSFRTFGRVQGNYRDIVDVHHSTNTTDFIQKRKMLSPAVIDGAVLRTIRATKDSYLGIKWLAENSYSSTRDICFVEMLGYTIDTNGEEVGFIATASIDVPECPDLSHIMKLTRVRMKRTILISPSADAPNVTSEIFVMGASEAKETSVVALMQYRVNMARLNNISLVIDSQNIAKQTLTLKKNWVPDESRSSCNICTRKFQTMYRRRHHCRMCGDVVCKTCYVTRSVPASETGRSRKFRGKNTEMVSQTKFCLRCVTELRTINKHEEEFTPFISKLLVLDQDEEGMAVPITEEDLELQSPDSDSNASSDFTYCDSSICNDSDRSQFHTIPALDLDNMNIDNDKKTQLRTDNIGGIGATVSVGSWISKYLQAPLPTNGTRLNSYGKLDGFHQNHSSSNRSSMIGPIEEKIVIKSNKINRIVAI